MDNETPQEPEMTPKEILDHIADTVMNTPMVRYRRSIMEAKMKAIGRARIKFEATHQKIGHVETGKTVLNKETGKREEIVVPVYQFTGWDFKKKYTGEKLREIRAAQLQKALDENAKAGHTTYSDGTPIIQDDMIDLKRA